MTDAGVYSPSGSLTNRAAAASVAEFIAETVMAETGRWWTSGGGRHPTTVNGTRESLGNRRAVRAHLHDIFALRRHARGAGAPRRDPSLDEPEFPRLGP